MMVPLVSRKSRDNMGLFLVCFMCSVSIIRAQELDHFDKDSTVDFSNGNVLAEILISTTTKTTKTTPDSTHRGWTTTTSKSSYRPRSTSRKAETTTTTEDTTKLSWKTTEDGGRLGRVVGREVTPESASEFDNTEKAGPTTEMEKESNFRNGTGSLGDIHNFESTDYMPPHITWPVSQQRLVVKSESEVNYAVHCRADGMPTPRFEWLKDDIPVKTTPGYIQAFTNGTLYVQKFTSRENGMYQCRATNRYGTSVSIRVLILKDELPGNIPGTDTTAIMDAKEGDAVAIRCADTPPTVSRHTRRWYFQKDSREVKNDERVGTDSEGTLRFAYVLPTDAAVYTCGLAPAESQPIIKFYNKVDLRVSPNTLSTTIPRKQFASENAKANIASKSLLECFFSGYPTPNLKWKNNSNHDITPGDSRYKVVDEGRKLEIIAVDLKDEGNFTCFAENVVGQQQQSLRLNVTTPPLRLPAQEGLTSLSTLTSPDQRDITLRCKARAAVGEHLDVPRWYRNGELLTEVNLPDSSRYQFSADRTELHINDLNKQADTACFQCNITNSEGYLFYDGYLRVIESIEIIKKPQESMEISYFDVIDISVVAKGDVCCPRDNHWEFEGKTLTKEDLQKPPFEWSNNGETLMFNASSVSNETLKSRVGHYMVRVSNKFDAVEVSFTISLREDNKTPGPQTAGDSNIKLWWVGLICGLLAIVIAIVVIIFFVKSNYPRDTYQLEKTELKHHLNPEEDLLNQSFQDI